PLRERWTHPLRRRLWIVQKPLQRVPQVMQREFFFDVLGYPMSPDLLLHLRSPVSRQKDHRLLGIKTVNLLQDREPIHPRHFQVKDHNIGLFAAKELQARRSTLREYHVIALPTK